MWDVYILTLVNFLWLWHLAEEQFDKEQVETNQQAQNCKKEANNNKKSSNIKKWDHL